MEKGATFDTFSDFEEALDAFKISENCDFFISDSRTLESSRRRYPNRVERAIPDLKYYSIKFRCVHGGTFKKKKGAQGIRQTSTLKKGCEAFIYLTLDRDGKKLMVANMNSTHNHVLSKVLFQNLPSQRKLAPKLKQDVIELLELKADKKLVREKILKETGRVISSRDLHKLAASYNTTIEKHAAEGNTETVCQEVQQNEEQLMEMSKLPDDDWKEMARNMLALKCDKTLLQKKIQEETGITVTLEDLVNTAEQNDNIVKQQKLSLFKEIDLLRQNYNADMEILKDEKDHFLGFFFQTKRMKTCVEAYPEFLAVDATYKLLEMDVPVYIFFVENSNCQNEVVGVALLTNEDKKTVEWMIEMFRKHNSSTSSTKSVMTDKDMKLQNALAAKLPHAKLVFCSFHILKIFSKDISFDRLGVNQTQKSKCLNLLQKLVNSKSEEEFAEIFKEFENKAPETVLTYYIENWQATKSDWYLGGESHFNEFWNSINSFLDLLNRNLKPVARKSSTFQEFLSQLFGTLTYLERKKDEAVILQDMKKPVVENAQNGDESKYLDLLTPAVAKYVQHQMTLSGEEKIVIIVDSNEFFKVSEGEELYKLTFTNCACPFYETMTLPCKHIFAIRKVMNQPLYDEKLCAERWHQHYYVALHTKLLQSNVTPKKTIVTEPTVKNKWSEKRRDTAIEVVMQIVDSLSKVTPSTFKPRIAALEKILKLWSEGVEVDISQITSECKEEKSSDAEDMSNITLVTDPATLNLLNQKAALANGPSKSLTSETAVATNSIIQGNDAFPSTNSENMVILPDVFVTENSCTSSYVYEVTSNVEIASHSEISTASKSGVDASGSKISISTICRSESESQREESISRKKKIGRPKGSFRSASALLKQKKAGHFTYQCRNFLKINPDKDIVLDISSTSSETESEDEFVSPSSKEKEQPGSSSSGKKRKRDDKVKKRKKKHRSRSPRRRKSSSSEESDSDSESEYESRKKHKSKKKHKDTDKRKYKKSSKSKKKKKRRESSDTSSDSES